VIGTLLSGRYRLESKLGSGGMSTVYLAEDETLGRAVAVKVLHREISDQPDQLERFRREARAVARLSHPNLVAVIDAGEDGGHPYIVFEYVPGETLKRRIDEQGPLGLDEAAAYAIEIGRGLACAHAALLVHRDVKPQNVLIDAEGRAKITDFGIARSLESSGLTATGRVLGTTDYVSPEQAMGKQVDARTDVYSLGVVLYEMITGDVPFHAETQVGVAMKHVNEALPDVQRRRPETSAALAAAVETATAKDPAERHADMNEFLDDLEGALEVEVSRAGHATGEATTVLRSVPSPQRKLLTKRRISWAGALLLLAAAAAEMAIAALGTDDPPSPAAGPEASEPAEIAIGGAIDFDPEGTPEQEEHPDEVGFAIDGNPTGTAWTTESYSGGLTKSGVGLILDPGEEVTPTELELRTIEPGWTAEIYGSGARRPPETFEEWEPELLSGGPIEIDSKRTTIDLNATSPNRWFLIWITELAEVPDQPGEFRVEISDARLRG
jgi:eukaryotic-like serine/threonine-protein kinase